MGMLFVVMAVVGSQLDAGVALSEAPQAEVDAILKAARQLTRSGDAEQRELAISKLEGCTERFPNAAECWRALAIAYAHANRPLEKSRDAFGRYLELRPPASPLVHQQFPWVDYPTVLN